MKRLEARLADGGRIVCGVASGMAGQYGWSCFWTRLAWLGAVLVNPALSLTIYFLVALLVKRWERRY